MKKSKSRKIKQDNNTANSLTPKTSQSKQTVLEWTIRKIIQSELGETLRGELKKILPPYMIQALPLDIKKSVQGKNESKANNFSNFQELTSEDNWKRRERKNFWIILWR